MLQCPEKVSMPAGGRRQMIDLARQAVADEGVTVSMTKLFQWFGIPRRSAYRRSQYSAPKVQPRFANPSKP
jgi:putative transposase